MASQLPALASQLPPLPVLASSGTIPDIKFSQPYATTLNIKQTANTAIINWQSFNIASGYTVNFIQQNSSSVILNRVTGNEQSVISGTLNANGQVFIVNSAGIAFYKGSQVHVGGLVASTLDISDSDFLKGHYNFSGASTASVVNQGRLHAHGGGYISLLGNMVENDGTITATLGTVVLASGTAMTLNFGGNSLIDVTVTQGISTALVQNNGWIKADGGHVIMTARAADQLLSAQVNNSGIIQARTMAALMGGYGASGQGNVRGHVHVGPLRFASGSRTAPHQHAGALRTALQGSTPHQGSIELLAIGGTVNLSGKLDASAPNGGNGGTIETSGAQVSVAGGAVITTASATGQAGTWTIDPDGFTIGIGGDISGATLGSALANNNVSIFSTQGSGNGGLNDGNLNVNDAVSWASANTLSLTATNAINVNAAITGLNGGLTLTAGTDINVNAQSSLQVATLGANANGNININAAQTWANNGNWAFAASNINVDAPVSWSAGTLTLEAANNIYINNVMTAAGAANLQTSSGYGTNADGSPQGLYMAFGTDASGNGNGTFKGKIDFSGSGGVTLNGQTYHVITNLGQLADLNGSCGFYVLGNDLDAANITYSSAIVSNFNGTLDGFGHVINNITLVDTSANANGTNYDGFIGTLGSASAQTATVRNLGLAYSQLTSLGGYTGGLAAQNYGTVVNDFVTGQIAAGPPVIGGLVGFNGGSTSISGGTVALGANIINSYADITMTDGYGVASGGTAGGLVGINNSGTAIYGPPGTILNSYAKGSLTAYSADDIGGLAGENLGTISNSWSGVAITTKYDNGTGVIGGLVGLNGRTGLIINNSYSTGALDVTDANAVGGIAGVNNGTIMGTVDGTKTGAASLVYETGNVTITITSDQTALFQNYSVGIGSSAGNQDYIGATGTLTINNYSKTATIANYGGLVGGCKVKKGCVPHPPTNPPGPPIINTSPPSTPPPPPTVSLPNTSQSITPPANIESTPGTSQGILDALGAGQSVASLGGQSSAAGELQSSIDTTATGSIPPSNVDSNIDITQQPTQAVPSPALERKRNTHNKTAATTPKKPNPGANLGATIRSIEINGEHFDLNDAKPGAETPPPPAVPEVQPVPAQ